MARSSPIIPSLNGGEISPWLEGRVDYEMFPKSLRLCQNFLPLIQGPIAKRSGTKYVASTKSGAVKSRLMPFVFTDSEAYALEFGNLYVRFFKTRGVVGAPYEVVTPYLEADLPFIRFAQSADVLYLACPGYAPRKLSRFGDTSWTLEVIDFIGGPYLAEDTQGVTLTPAGTGHITPDMTSNTAPSGTAENDDTGADAFRPFDQNGASVMSVSGLPAWVSYTFPAGTKVADAYWIQADELFFADAPSSWEFQGYNGSTWVVLDSRTGETGWRGSERRYFDFVNETGFSAYRLYVTSVNDGGSDLRFTELAIHEKATTQTPFNLTASATTGINGGAGFVTSDVGRSIRLYGSDGQYRTAKIITRTSSTVVTVQIDGQALPDRNPIARWQFSSWSAFNGYPSAVTFYGDRLVWGGSATQPQTIWGSAVGDYENHTPGAEAADALNITLSSGDVNHIKWMVGDEKGLLVGASRGEFLVRPSSANEALSPTNVQATRTTDYGSSDVVPQRVGKAIAFIQRAARKLRELAFVIDVDGYRAPDLTIRAEHITAPGVVDLAYQSQPSSIIWAPRSDGVLAGFTYERDQEAMAWHRHILGGFSDSGRTAAAIVESVVAIPAPDGFSDDLWLQVRRYINGATVRHIEYMTGIFDHRTEQNDGFFIDSGVTYSGAATTSITGLGHLNGETVRVLADGAVHPERAVAAGAITLDAAAAKVHVGLGYRAHAITERFDNGTPPGFSAQGKLKRIVNVIFRVYRSGAFKFGGTYDETEWQEVDTRSSDDDMDEAPALITADLKETWPTGWETDGCIHIISDDPTPLTMLAIIPTGETTP